MRVLDIGTGRRYLGLNENGETKSEQIANNFGYLFKRQVVSPTPIGYRPDRSALQCQLAIGPTGRLSNADAMGYAAIAPIRWLSNADDSEPTD